MTILRILGALLLSCSALAQSPAVIRSVTSSGGALNDFRRQLHPAARPI
jgi:hypothetical protein